MTHESINTLFVGLDPKQHTKRSRSHIVACGEMLKYLCIDNPTVTHLLIIPSRILCMGILQCIHLFACMYVYLCNRFVSYLAVLAASNRLLADSRACVLNLEIFNMSSTKTWWGPTDCLSSWRPRTFSLG